MREKNNHKKLGIILTSCVLLTIIIVFIVIFVPKNHKKTINNNIDTNISAKKEKDKKVEDKGEESVTDDVDNTPKIEEEKSIPNNEAKKENQPKQEEPKKNEVKQEQPKVENTQPAQQPVQQVQEQPKVVEQPREQTAWEQLGISEYDYYHKPMWSWARVDYKVENYGTLEQTHQACIEEGYRLQELEQISSFTCSNINSYAGNYLGDMLKTR